MFTIKCPLVSRVFLRMAINISRNVGEITVHILIQRIPSIFGKFMLRLAKKCTKYL